MRCYLVEFRNGQTTVVELAKGENIGKQLEKMFGINGANPYGSPNIVKITLLD